MEDITTSLNKLSLLQMVLAWTFVACYALALGGMLESRGARRAAALAVVAAVVFCALSENWVHGALLVMFAVAGMGVFVAAAWALVSVVGWALRQRAEKPAAVAPAVKVAKPHQPIGVMLRALWRWEA
jgi:MFS family permease